ncbi:MAG: hypothetical protein HYZ18_03815 [Pseudogulbenkiania sp.]|nr:hypothetical protein [Pseudogulbenkiania sp.]
MKLIGMRKISLILAVSLITGLVWATPLRVFDSNGKRVGDVISVYTADGPAAITVDFQQQNIVLWAYSYGLSADSGGRGLNVYFTTADCTGTPYVDEQGATLLPLAVLARPGRTLYFGDSTVTPFQPLLSSLLPGETRGGATGACTIIAPSSERRVVPAIRLIDLDTLFTPPFSVR